MVSTQATITDTRPSSSSTRKTQPVLSQKNKDLVTKHRAHFLGTEWGFTTTGWPTFRPRKHTPQSGSKNTKTPYLRQHLGHSYPRSWSAACGLARLELGDKKCLAYVGNRVWHPVMHPSQKIPASWNTCSLQPGVSHQSVELTMKCTGCLFFCYRTW